MEAAHVSNLTKIELQIMWIKYSLEFLEQANFHIADELGGVTVAAESHQFVNFRWTDFLLHVQFRSVNSKNNV